MPISLRINDCVLLNNEAVVTVVAVKREREQYEVQTENGDTFLIDDDQVKRVLRGKTEKEIEKRGSELRMLLRELLDTLSRLDGGPIYAGKGPRKNWDLNDTEQSATEFCSNRPEDLEDVMRMRLWRTKREDSRRPIREQCTYFGIPLEASSEDEKKLLTGVCQIVVRADSPSVIIVGYRHHQIAQGKNVLFAGQIYLDDQGMLRRWDNDTGHYATHPGFHRVVTEIKSQDDNAPILALDDFRTYHLTKRYIHALQEEITQAGNDAQSQDAALQRILYNLSHAMQSAGRLYEGGEDLWDPIKDKHEYEEMLREKLDLKKYIPELKQILADYSLNVGYQKPMRSTRKWF